MGELTTRKAGQLVVRYDAPWRRRAMLILLVLGGIVLLYGTYEWGRFDGGYRVFTAIQERREDAAGIAMLKDENSALRARLANADTARNVEHRSYADVEKGLGDLQTQVQRQREELAFYRGIVSPQDGIGGLRIQRLDVLSGVDVGHFKIRLVLMQSMRQDSVVSGTVKIELEGSKNKQPQNLNLAQIGGPTRDGGDVAFSFRYFQNIEQDIVLPEGFQPQAIDVEVRSSHQQPLHQSFPWNTRAPS